MKKAIQIGMVRLPTNEQLCIYRTEGGALFGVDASWVEQMSDECTVQMFDGSEVDIQDGGETCIDYRPAKATTEIIQMYDDQDEEIGLIETSDCDALKKHWNDWHENLLATFAFPEDDARDQYDLDGFVEWHNREHTPEIERAYIEEL